MGNEKGKKNNIPIYKFCRKTAPNRTSTDFVFTSYFPHKNSQYRTQMLDFPKIVKINKKQCVVCLFHLSVFYLGLMRILNSIHYHDIRKVNLIDTLIFTLLTFVWFFNVTNLIKKNISQFVIKKIKFYNDEIFMIFISMVF